eukprot:g45635.t1
MVGNQKVLSFVAFRVQMFYKTMPESTLGLTDVEEATSGAVDTVDQVGRCTGEPLLDRKSLLWALNGGVERPILAADVPEAKELGVRDRILAGGWVRGGVVQVAMEVGGLGIDVSVEAVTRDGDREAQEGEGSNGDGPGEFEVGVKGVSKVDELLKLLVGAQGSADTVINVAEEEVGDSASVAAEKGLLQEVRGVKGEAVKELRKNMNQDKTLEVNKNIEEYGKTLQQAYSSLIVTDDEINIRDRNRDKRNGFREINWDELELIVEMEKLPPYPRKLTEGFRTVLWGVFFGFVGSTFLGAISLYFIIKITEKDYMEIMRRSNVLHRIKRRRKPVQRIVYSSDDENIHVDKSPKHFRQYFRPF